MVISEKNKYEPMLQFSLRDVLSSSDTYDILITLFTAKYNSLDSCFSIDYS